jgi:hypothetical protein
MEPEKNIKNIGYLERRIIARTCLEIISAS